MSLLNTHLFRVCREQTCISKWNYITSNSYISLLRLCRLNKRIMTARDAMTAIKINFGTNWASSSTLDRECLGERYEITHRANSKKAKSRKRS